MKKLDFNNNNSEKKSSLQNDRRSRSGSRGRNKKTSVLKKILCILLVILAVLLGLAAWILTRSKPEKQVEPDFSIELEPETEETIDENAPELNSDRMDDSIVMGDTEEGLTQDDGWVHYLLLGIDIGEEENADPSTYENRRSDAMIVLSINETAEKVVLSSIPRDTLVYIEGRGKFDKLTHAYRYGKAPLTVQTFEDNFDIDISGYITVNFSAMVEIVDLLGGLTLTLTDKEAEHMGEQYAAWGLSGGTQLLTGSEVLAYCRIRKIDSDFVRNERQFSVLKTMYEKIKAMPITKYPEMISTVYDDIYTDLTLADCISLAGTIMDILEDSELINGKLVDRSHSTTPTLNKVSYVMVDDLEETVIRWREEVLGITDYVPSAKVTAISEKMKELIAN